MSSLFGSAAAGVMIIILFIIVNFRRKDSYFWPRITRFTQKSYNFAA